MTVYRALEFIPGVLAWTTILLIVVFSRLAPAGVAIFIIVFDIYWFLKTLYLSTHLRATFKKLRENMKTDWFARLKREGKSWERMRHLVIFPMATEPFEVLQGTFAFLTSVNYPLEKFMVVLAVEGRVGERAREVAQKIEAEFGGRFFRFLVTEHPANLPDEIPGKGSNETWAGKKAKEMIDALPEKIRYEDILVSVFDCDTQVGREYFGILTHAFLSAEYPQRSSYQPIPLFVNNIFQAPALARIVAFSTTFWNMVQQARPERLTTFSSHSMPFKALVEVGFWNTNVVSEDSQIFWQCLLHYKGDWRVVPITYPVSMDANVATTFWRTMRNIYKQQRRWGWGCENVPYFMYGFLTENGGKTPRRTKWYWAFNYIEGFHSWATNSLMIFTLGWLPIMIGGREFGATVLSYNLPRMTQLIMLFSTFGIVSSAILSIILLPPKPAWFRTRHYALYALQWLLMPFTLIIFGAFPALEAQTRLMLGGRFRLSFWVTPKYR